MLSSLKLFALKLAIFSSVLFYLALDLWVFQGPVWYLVHERALQSKEQDKLDSVMAELHGEKYRDSDWAELQRALAYLNGVEQMPASAKWSILFTGLQDRLLYLRLRYNDNNVDSFMEEAKKELERMKSRSRSPKHWEKQLSEADISEEDLLHNIERLLRQQSLLERSVTAASTVSDEELLKYYEVSKQHMRLPAQRALRHLFIRGLNRTAQEGEQLAATLMQRLEAGEEFSDLVKKYSDDIATSRQGGQLGMLDETHSLAVLGVNICDESILPSNKATLITSDWGWHICLAEPIVASHIPSYEECRESLRSALESARRERAIQQYFDDSFKELRTKDHLRIHAK